MEQEKENAQQPAPPEPAADQMRTNVVLDLLMSDQRRVLALVGAFVLFVGSYCNFWGTYSEAFGRNSRGNLFTGFLCGGIFGKLCVIGAFAVAALICLGLSAYAWYAALASMVFFAVQTVLVAGWGTTVAEGTDAVLYPGLGSFISLAGLAVMLIYTWKLRRHTKPA